jgi:hypothetical protein
MARQNNFGFQLGDTGDRCLEVVDFKPQEHSVPVGLVIRIADWPVVVFDLKAVQLEDQHTLRRDQSLIFRPAVVAPTVEESLVPTAAAFDISYRNQGLGTHDNLRRWGLHRVMQSLPLKYV